MAEEEPEQPQKNEQAELEEQVVHLNRTSKVVKGGRSFHMTALVVVGDRNGNIGIGTGKAKEVPEAIRKGSEQARRALVRIPLRQNRTLTHPMKERFRGAEILMRPAAEGTGLIAGGGMRAVLELAGVKDVLAKSLGSDNPINVVKATMQALCNMHSKEHVLEKRDISAL